MGKLVYCFIRHDYHTYTYIQTDRQADRQDNHGKNKSIIF